MGKDTILILAIVASVVVGFVVVAYGWRAADAAAECELKCRPRESHLVRDPGAASSAGGEPAPLVCRCYDK